MLKLNYNLKDEVYTVDRVSFPVPCYVKEEEKDDFRKSVFGYSDDELIERLSEIGYNKDGDIIDEAAVNDANEQIDAIKNSGLYVEWNSFKNGRAFKAFAIGIDMLKNDSKVPAEFVKVYDAAMKYQAKYINVAEWDDDRKAAFTAVREAMVNCFNGIFGEVLKDGFDLKISSKEVNLFLNSLILTKNRTNKVSKRGTDVEELKLFPAFKSYMRSINHVTGVNYTKVKIEKVSIF